MSNEKEHIVYGVAGQYWSYEPAAKDNPYYRRDTHKAVVTNIEEIVYPPCERHEIRNIKHQEYGYSGICDLCGLKVKALWVTESSSKADPT